MAVASSSIVAGVGARYGVVFVLDSNGLPMPASPGSLPYVGTIVEGIKEYNLTGAEAQQINHYGDDRVFAADQLAPTESPSFAMTTGKDNQTLDKGLTGVLERVYSTTRGKFIAAETNKRGQEPQVAGWFFRQALDVAKGSSTFGSLRQYNTRSINSMKVSVNPNGGAQTLSDQTYNAVITPTTKTFWGETYNNTDWGCTEASLNRGNINYPGIWHHYHGSLGIGTYVLNYAPVNGDPTAIMVWVNGSYTVPGSVTFGASPAFSLTATPPTGTMVSALVLTDQSI